VAKNSIEGVTPGAPLSAARPASTPIVVVSSSKDATARLPRPPPEPSVAVIFERWRRLYGM